MLVDTDVLIWHLRGYPQATRRLDQLGALTISAASYLEVLQGLRNKAELAAVQKMMLKRQATMLPLTEAITRRAVALMEALTLSHGVQWAMR
jgi:predicted nucleic acid-binding protein